MREIRSLGSVEGVRATGMPTPTLAVSRCRGCWVAPRSGADSNVVVVCSESGREGGNMNEGSFRRVAGRMLKNLKSDQVEELLYRQTGVSEDAFERPRVHRIAAGYCDHGFAVPHGDVLALADDAETGANEGAHDPLVRLTGRSPVVPGFMGAMRTPGKARRAHFLREDRQLANFLFAEDFLERGQVGFHGVLDIVQGLLLRASLAPAAAQLGAMRTVAHVRFFQDRMVEILFFHPHTLTDGLPLGKAEVLLAASRVGTEVGS